MSMFKRRPVAVVAAVAALIEAIIGVMLVLEWIEPELATPIMTVVAASVTVVQRVVSPVEKVAKLLDKPVEVVDRMLGGVK